MSSFYCAFTHTAFHFFPLILYSIHQASVTRQKLQLVGVTALLLAAKYEEIYPPEVRDLVYVTDKAYTRRQILSMESAIVSTLSFKLTVPTMFPFLVRFIKAGELSSHDAQIAQFFAEKTLAEYGMLKFLPSTIATATAPTLDVSASNFLNAAMVAILIHRSAAFFVAFCRNLSFGKLASPK